ncbi:MAG: nucleotide sugar dehydrogenase [Polyangiales bacterium]
MKVGFIGLGKLGLPTALAFESRGHAVFGCDPSPEVAAWLRTRRYPHAEEGVDALLPSSRLALRPIDDVVRDAEVVFVTVQTPHAPAFEGVTRLPDERRDFDYGPLGAAVGEVAGALERTGATRDVVVVSTVLPGTMRREVIPRLGPRGRLGYNPFFIAMGTTVPDVLNPEFVLFGGDDGGVAERVAAFYQTLHDAPFCRVSIEDAELAKVLYNTFISTKIAFANTAAELAHKTGADVDRVMGALMFGTRRIVSPAYLRAGMGDGGGCHPRDNIALSWLARERGLSFDWFDAVMRQREEHAAWLARLTLEHARGLPVVVLGKAFKSGTAITTGSPALLLVALLRELGCEPAAWDPLVDPPAAAPAAAPACFVVATRHEALRAFPFPAGSVVIDPWRFVEAGDGVTVVRVGAP